MSRPFAAITIVLAGAFFSLFGTTLAGAPAPFALPSPTPTGHIATAAELAQARADYLHSRHANTFDNGQGANTTCARCKSPKNWDPQAPAAAQALDCSTCKRIPGAPRPDLEGGVPVEQADWQNLGCEICHQPAGSSYITSVSFWNQATKAYEPVASVTDLCAKCHEGQHGFMVIEEQTASPAHRGWECTRCHGAHGTPSQCTNCHDPTLGAGAAEHARHPQVNCTACHDAGGLSIWHDGDSNSRHYNEYAPIRFAHALRSWTSHALARQVACQRCHHPRNETLGPVVENVLCNDCHPEGAVLFWCRFFPRDFPFGTPTPLAVPTKSAIPTPLR